MSIQQLRESRNGFALEARKLMDETKDQKWTAEHQLKYDNLTGNIVDLDARIEREQKVLDLAAEEHFERKEVKAGKKDTEDHLGEVQIFDKWMRRGERGLSQEQAQKFYNTVSTTTPFSGLARSCCLPHAISLRDFPNLFVQALFHVRLEQSDRFVFLGLERWPQEWLRWHFLGAVLDPLPVIRIVWVVRALLAA